MHKKYNDVHSFSWCKRARNVSTIWDGDSYSSLLGDFMLTVKFWSNVHQ